MQKIIRLNEAGLIDLVKKILNKQPNVADNRFYKIIDHIMSDKYREGLTKVDKRNGGFLFKNDSNYIVFDSDNGKSAYIYDKDLMQRIKTILSIDDKKIKEILKNYFNKKYDLNMSELKIHQIRIAR